MSATVTITNLTSSAVALNDLYISLGPAGASNASVVINRSAAQLDQMSDLNALVKAGTVSISIVPDTNDVDLLTAPVSQTGKALSISVNATGMQTSAVTFAKPFSSAPKVRCSSVQSGTTGWKGHAYAQAVTASGFTVGLDVTTAVSGTVTGENPTFSPAENGSLLGPFAATLAHAPLTSAALTIHWTEATVAKSATLTGTSTIGGTNAANLSAASIDRTTGALSVTFAATHPPDTNSITVDYTQLEAADVHWVATL